MTRTAKILNISIKPIVCKNYIMNWFREGYYDKYIHENEPDFIVNNNGRIYYYD